MVRFDELVPSAAWLEGLGHACGLDAFLHFLSLCCSGRCSWRSACWVTALIGAFQPAASSQQEGWKQTQYLWNPEPRCERDVPMLMLLIPRQMSLLQGASAAYEEPSSPTCLQWDHTDGISRESEDMHRVAEESVLVASWLTGRGVLQSPEQALPVPKSSLSLWDQSSELV